MKRSKSIGLITMGASVIALTACDEPKVDALVFDTLQQCLADKDLRTGALSQRGRDEAAR